MLGSNVHSNKIQNIIAHFLVSYDTAEQLNKNNLLIAKVFIHVTLIERLFDEKRRIVESTSEPNQESLLQHSIKQLCDLKSPESIHDFIEIVANLDSSKYRIEIPYDDITAFIYNFKDAIQIEAVNERLNEFSEILKSSLSAENKNNALKVEKVYKKFERHIKLAISQKRYIDDATSKSSKEAKNIADLANLTAHNAKIAANTANEISGKVQRALGYAERTIEQAQESATKALALSNNVDSTMSRAKTIADTSERVAHHAQQLANEADAQAKSTIANYISILGIFASIIFTLFGGVNLIGSTVKLLEVNSRWPYLTFIISLLMICLLTLLNMLVKWINSMSNLKRALETQNKNDGVHNTDKCRLYNPFSWDFYSKSVSSFLVILIISLVGMYNVNKENLFTVTNETTTKIVAATPPSVEPNNKKPSETVETTEVKKLTVTNKIKEDAREENKEEKTEN